MNISPDEAEEALAAIQKVTDKTRRSIAGSGAYIFLIVTGIVWLVGFLSTQFLTGEIVAYIWIGISLLGTALSIPVGIRMGKRVRSPSFGPTAKRATIFWLLLAFYAVAVIAVAQPAEGKQVTMFVILFIMLGQLAMGLILSFSTTWWALPITALALTGYFLLPDFFYLWMGVLVGGGMIAFGLYIRLRW
ncbi:MAG: hypothetical protein M1281_15605 [Chloroflexi bacterium]|nr:hypothetical protein [Chloroflexota bacterium]